MAKSIMIQGTMSNAGKSIVTGGLCRVLRQDGYNVAPFKSQNMALNSFITRDGLEMGRAQVMQAEAAGIEPSVLMNPVLLKPSSDTGSQVIVKGKVTGVMTAAQYYQRKQELIPVIQDAYNQLSAAHDIIVIEGAGSPAEINLQAYDIVNMGMAKMADAPVILVGDIDRGGVFAQIVGTIALLEEQDKQRVKGIVINKFRGDKQILKPGLDMLTERIRIPVCAVLPMIEVDIDEEDSLSERFHKKTAASLVDIAVIRLPRISNFTDFAPLECMEEVSLRYVGSPADLGQPDAIMLPGSKSTLADLKWLRESGLETLILKHAAAGKLIFGICGGYQMLGREIHDPQGVEGGGSLRGMNLLPAATRLTEGKTRTRVEGHFAQVKGVLSGMSGLSIEGYEIHMGETKISSGESLLTMTETQEGSSNAGKPDGSQQGNVYGVYVHGIFDRREAADGFIGALLKEKGCQYKPGKRISWDTYKEEQYDKLADMIRANMDMEAIYQIIERGSRGK